jgi:hypothetical protein
MPIMRPGWLGFFFLRWHRLPADGKRLSEKPAAD